MIVRRLALLTIGLMLAAAAPLASTPLSRMDLPWWRARFDAKQQELARGKYDLMWLGDSITEDFEQSAPPPFRDFQPVWNRYYAPRRAINLGFKGDTTAHLLWRLQNGELAGQTPKAVVVLIGANNFGRLHWPAEPTLAGIDAITATLRARLPHTKILLLSVLPSIRSDWVDQNTAIVNRALAQRYAHDPAVTFLDVTQVFLTNGRVDPANYIDPRLGSPALHPTSDAQARLAAFIEPTLARLMGDHPR